MSNKNVHLYWAIGVLITVICILVAVLFCGLKDDKILDFISAFSTLLSIVLSIIAIFYTFVSGMESQRINQITESEIQHINAKIETLVEKMQFSYSMIANLDNHISSIIDNIESTEDLSNDETTVEERQEELVKNLKGLKMQIHDIAANFNTNLE